MTPFEKWCEENGFDPKGEFVVMENTLAVGKGTKLTLKHDDNTHSPMFNTSNRRGVYVHYIRLTQHKTEPKMTEHKTEPKMTEQKLLIPRMVEVRVSEDQEWVQRELLADMSGFGVKFPYACRSEGDSEKIIVWQYMREIPKTRPMTPRELLDAIRGGAVWSYDRETVSIAWTTSIVIGQTWICHDWNGTDSDIWVKAEVTE